MRQVLWSYLIYSIYTCREMPPHLVISIIRIEVFTNQTRKHKTTSCQPELLQRPRPPFSHILIQICPAAHRHARLSSRTPHSTSGNVCRPSARASVIKFSLWLCASLCHRSVAALHTHRHTHTQIADINCTAKHHHRHHGHHRPVRG